MSTLDLNAVYRDAPDFTAPDLNGDQIPEDYELVHWYNRPGWPFGRLTPTLAVVGAFAVGVVVGAGVFAVGSAIRDHLED